MRRDALYDFRKHKGLTQPEMASKIGISTSFYKRIELGDENPSFGTIRKFCEAFETDDLDLEKLFMFKKQ